MVSLMLQHIGTDHAEINRSFFGGATPLWVASWSRRNPDNHTVCQWRSRTDSPALPFRTMVHSLRPLIVVAPALQAIVRMLLGAHALPTEGPMGLAPLHRAAMTANVEVVQALLPLEAGLSRACECHCSRDVT